MVKVEVKLVSIYVDNVCSEVIVVMEIEKVWLEVMFKIISEMVKFVEKIKGISINYVMGMGFLGGGDGSVKVFVS